MNPYADIIDMPHHVSNTRPQMPMADRAAQFSPFDTLVGYDEAILETSRLTDARPALSEEAMAALDVKWQFLAKNLDRKPAVTITYFVPDARKAGGALVTAHGTVKKADTFERYMLLCDGTRIPLDDILDMEGEIFSGLPL